MSERCWSCGADLDRFPPVEVHASVAGPDWDGIANADTHDPSDRVEECMCCLAIEPRSVEEGSA